MGVEIERKFLLRGDDWRPLVTRSHSIVQGYLGKDDKATIRIRIIDGTDAVLTIKGARADGARPEFEYPIPIEDAQAMLPLCGDDVVQKRRHIVPEADGRYWEIDLFEGSHAGFRLAEIELDHPDAEIALPNWIGEEVSEDSRYSNENIARLGIPPR
ncbi:CYTH domain-containing protein [Arsenicitalea aurantiaca]|uniref:CYTH domain-containing protein n=1 Tax=Arsenicitalea aurantiaca TaxID=1783274 RepID=A0A433XEY2_9HYPH|nr:CYTH domain-containing protein [Arsenicitalea aurantiaca]RUT32616.1 CYTH domain-containing protein [Arsenicitalea aurantiaca]